ncbi:hypothetical protein [Virgibacillus salexigens]|uniref:Uncharacterized protein n=1 Tax=Virgibacillus kapii TaxID=1638645 RepID=A0ABQ2DUP0_9BACI|nr:hypothetical protein [Virgibacillus kapii]GGJ70977.1 hypothetical protein GCM10007111_35750 [Virgibacillus kapii]
MLNQKSASKSLCNKRDLIAMIDEIFYYSMEQHLQRLLEETERFAKDIHLSETWYNKLYVQWLWWTIFCIECNSTSRTIYQQFLERSSTRDYPEPIRQVLGKWKQVDAGFYIIETSYDRPHYIMCRDLVDHQVKPVQLASNRVNYQIGDLVTGLLLPFPDGMYFSPSSLCKLRRKLSTPLASDIQTVIHPTTSSQCSSNYPILLKTILRLVDSPI